MTPQENLRRAILNDEFPEDSDADRLFAPTGEDALRLNRNIAVSAWMSQTSGSDINAGSATWQHDKDALAQGFFKIPTAKNMSDESIHDLIRSHIQTSDNTTNLALESALSGRPLPQALSELHALTGVAKTRGIRDRYLNEASSIYGNVAAKVAPYRGIIKEAAGTLSKEMDFAVPTTDAFQSVAEKLLQVPEKDRRIVIEAIGATGGATAEERSSYLNKVAATLGRYSEMLGGRSESMVESISGTVQQLANAPAEIASLLSGGNMGIQSQAAGAGERSKATEAELNRVRDLQLLTDDIRKIASQKVDPVKGNGWVQQLGLDVASMIPQTAVAIANPTVGYAANLAYFRDDIASNFKAQNPGATTAQADKISAVAAPVNAAIETVTALIPWGKVKLPVLQKWLMSETASVGGAARNFGIRAITGTGAEIGEEWLQAYAPLKAQELMSGLKQDMPSVDWEKNMPKFADIAAEVWAPALLFSLVGGGVASINDIKNGRSLAADLDMLVAKGVAPETAAKIKEASDAGDYNKVDSLFRAEFVSETKASKPDIQAATERIKARFKAQENVEALTETTSPEYTASVTRTPSGWQVTTGDGTIIPVESAEAARRIAVDLRQVGSQQEADALVGVIDGYYASGKQIETVFTGEDVKASETVGVVATRRDANNALLSQRQFGPQALETVRAEAEVAGIKSDTRKVFAHINGSNEAFPMRVADGAKGVTRILNLYRSQEESQPQVITFLHENIESSWRLGMANGTFSEQETRTAFSALLPAFEGIQTTDAQELQFIDNVRTLANGGGNDTMMRETVSEMVVRDVLGRDRDGRATGMKPGSISRAIEASVMGANTQEQVSALKSILAAIKAFTAYLKAVFSTVDAISTARDNGTIGEDWDAFVDKVLGIDEVKRDEGKVADEVKAFMEDSNMPFSISPAFSVSQEYWMNHRPNADGPRAFDLAEGGISPADVYDHPEWYSGYSKVEIAETVRQLKAVRGKPESILTIYRASPKSAINSGDWVTLSKSYATTHAQGPGDGRDFKILSAKVKASDVRWAMDDLMEFGYFGDDLDAANTGATFSISPASTISVPTSDIDTIPEDLARAEADMKAGGKDWAAKVDLSQPVGVYRGEDGRLKLFDGHHRRLAARERGEPLQVRESVFGRAVPIGEAPVVADMPDGAQLVGPATFSITAYHGTPHKVDKFTTAKIGTGEGAQAFGWGLYMAESKDVAKGYRDKLSGNAKPGQLLDIQIRAKQRTVDSWKATYETQPNESNLDQLRMAEADLARAKGESGFLYTVELLPDEADFLDWDKPLSEQSEKVKAALASTGLFTSRDLNPPANFVPSPLFNSGRGAYDILKSNEESDEKASKLLASLGIAGMKYFDGNSRNIEFGTRNYVIFDESLVKILEENGQKVEGQSFSISPIRNLNELSDQVERQFKENPVGALEVKSKVIRQFAKIADKWSNERWTPQGNKIRPISEKRTVKSLDKEQAMRQARAEGEKIAANMEASQALKEAKAEAQAWRDEADAMQKEDWSPKESLVRDLITLEAIVAMFPQEIRGKIGGFVTLARKASESARLKVLQKQLERGQVLLEKHLKGQYGTATDKLLDRYKSQKDASGRITGKILSTATEQVDWAAAVMDMTIEQQSEKSDVLEKIIENPKDGDDVQDALNRLGILRLFEVWDTKDSAAREAAFNWLAETIELGKQGKKILDEERKAFLTDIRQSAQLSILKGDKLNPAAADEITNLNKGVLKSALLRMRGILSSSLWTTLGRLELTFGEDSKILNHFAEKIINAANLSTDIKRLVEAQKKEALSIIFNSDSKFAHARGIAELQKMKKSGISIRKVVKKEVKLDLETLTKLNDGTMSAETAGLRQDEADAALKEFANNGRKSSVTIEQIVDAGEPVERTMSETQGIQWWLWSMQDASRKQMERDGWDADSFAQLEKFLSPEAKALGRWISGSYQDAADLIEPVYRKLFNAPLPRTKNYSPIYRRNMNTGGDIMDMDASDMSSGLAAGFVQARVNTTAALVESDALAVFLAQWENVSHWVSHAELMRDMKGVLLDKDTAVAIRQKKSEGYLQRLKEDIKTIESNGTNSAKELVDISRMWRWFMQFRAYKGLAFRISPIIKQTPALLNPLLADVPAHNYMMGMARAFMEPQTFAKEVSAMWSSDIIRRRIESGFSAESRVAIQGSSMTGSQAILAMQSGMMPMSMVDGGWTALGAAISFDYYRRGYMRDNPQMTPELADSAAIARVEKMIATSAQPSDVYARALYERSGNPFMRSMSMFVSDQRKTLAIELMAIRRLATGKSKNKALDVQRAVVAHVVMASVSQVMAGVIASLLGDDEDRDREWSAEQWTLALALGPINGLFVFGRLIDKIGRGLLGLRVFPNDDLASKAASDLLRGGKNMDELFNPDDPEEFMDALDSASSALGAGMSAAFGPVGGAVDVGANLVREGRKVAKRKSE